MTAPTHPDDPPMAEPGKRTSGSDVGGVRSTTQGGVADWAQRSTERSEEPATGRAATGDAAGGAADPRVDLGGKGAPGSAAGASARSERPPPEERATPRPAPMRPAGTGAGDAGARRNDKGDDDEDEWRHEPVAPVDEKNPLRSLGKAVGETLTGSDAPTPPKR